MRRSSYGTGFLLAYVILGVGRAFLDIIRGLFEALVNIFHLARRGIENTSTRRDAFEKRFRVLVGPYLTTLAQKRAKLLVTDDYGELRDERWSKELGYFMGKVLWPRLGSDLAFVERNMRYVCTLLDDIVAEEQTALK